MDDPLGWLDAMAHREPCLAAHEDVPCVLETLGNGDGDCPWGEWAQCEAEQRPRCPHIEKFPYWRASADGGGAGNEGYGMTAGEAIAELARALEDGDNTTGGDVT